MRPEVKKFKPASEYYFQEGCFIIELHNSLLDPQVSIARAKVLSGETTKWHKLENTWERYVIQSGVGIVEVGQEDATEVLPGDVVVIPPGERQRISNTGQEELVFLAICSPRFEAENYHPCE